MEGQGYVRPSLTPRQIQVSHEGAREAGTLPPIRSLAVRLRLWAVDTAERLELPSTEPRPPGGLQGPDTVVGAFLRLGELERHGYEYAGEWSVLGELRAVCSR